jgi:antitoxin component YwqK of YwqJK toxin-antitoxin module
MKVVLRSWFGSLALAGALGASSAFAQQKLSTVELAQPIAASPASAEAGAEDGEPTPAALQPSPATPVPAGPAPKATAPKASGPVEAKVSDESDPDAAATESTDSDEPAAESSSAQHEITPVPLPATGNDEGEPTDDAPIEIVKERYPSGVVRVEREVTQDAAGNYIPHGNWRQYDPTGRLIAEGRFIQSKKEGIWRRLYRGDDAPLLATSPYSSFTPPFVSQATFRSGNLHGKWIITDAKERKVHELEFVDGERHGTSTWYFPSGQIMLTGMYEHGRANGEVIQYGPDSAIIARETYEEGRKLAPKIDYYDAQQLAKKTEAMFLHAALHVKSADQWDTCTLAVFEARGQDEKHGPFTSWHKNGQLARQGEFRYDLPVGTFLYWYPNGQKQMEGTYTDGRQTGQWVWWHENGLKSIGGEYENGTPVGVWSWWQASGKLSQRADLSERSQVGPVPEVDDDTREAKVKLAEPVVEVR